MENEELKIIYRPADRVKRGCPGKRNPGINGLFLWKWGVFYENGDVDLLFVPSLCQVCAGAEAAVKPGFIEESREWQTMPEFICRK